MLTSNADVNFDILRHRYSLSGYILRASVWPPRALRKILSITSHCWEWQQNQKTFPDTPATACHVPDELKNRQDQWNSRRQTHDAAQYLWPIAVLHRPLYYQWEVPFMMPHYNTSRMQRFEKGSRHHVFKNIIRYPCDGWTGLGGCRH